MLYYKNSKSRNSQDFKPWKFIRRLIKLSKNGPFPECCSNSFKSSAVLRQRSLSVSSIFFIRKLACSSRYSCTSVFRLISKLASLALAFSLANCLKDFKSDNSSMAFVISVTKSFFRCLISADGFLPCLYLRKNNYIEYIYILWLFKF